MSVECCLADLQPGQSGTVKAMGESHAALRLQELGLLPGTVVQLLRRAPLGDPLELQLRGYCLSLRKAEAAQVRIVR